MTPETYRCAVSFAGVSDIPDIMRDERLNWGQLSTQYAYWKDHIGEDRRAWREYSPINHIDAVRAPILLIHGDRDYTVDVSQSRQMARALERAGKPHHFVELENETHHLTRQSTRQQFLEAIDVFLAEHLGPGVR
jgi:dipeptidyl aminopeptidase/acylaminoacyl peptidase